MLCLDSFFFFVCIYYRVLVCGYHEVFFVCCLVVGFFLNFILAALGLRCCVQAFSSCSEGELLFIAVRGLLIVVASPVAEHGL